MPVSNPEFRRKLALAGENPDEYDDPTEPNVKPEAATNKQGFLESLSAAGTSALRSSPSTALGISAGAGITGLTSELGPIAPLLGLVGGTAVGVGSRMLQDHTLKSILPTSMYDAYKAREAQDIKEHPTASAVGEIIPQALAFRPSPTGIINASKALINPAKDEATKLIEQQALKHVLVNAGTQAGVGIGTDLVTGNEITPKGVGENALMGGFLNKSTALGKKLMFERNNNLPETQVKKEEVLTTENKVETQVSPNYNSVEPSYADSTELALSAGAVDKKGKSILPSPDAEITAIQKINKEEQAKQEEKNRLIAHEKANLDAQAKAEALAEELKNNPNPNNISKVEEPIQMGEQLPKDEFDLSVKKRNYLQVAFEKAKQEMELHDLEAKIKEGQIPKATGVSEERNPIQTTELGKEIPPDYTGNMEYDNLSNAKDSGLADQIHNKLEGLKVKGEGKLYGGVEGLSTAAWNGSLNAVQGALKGGVKLSEAIKSGLDYIKKNHPDEKFNEKDFHLAMYSHLSPAISDLKLKDETKPSVKDSVKIEEPTLISHNQGERVAHLFGARSEIDKLANIGKGDGFLNKDSAEPNAKLTAKGLTDLQEKHTEYLGQLLNPFQQEVAKIQGTRHPFVEAASDPLNALKTIANPIEGAKAGLKYIRQEGPEAREAMKFVNDTKEGRPTTPLSRKASEILKAATTAFDKVRAYAIKNAKTLGHEAKDYTEGYFPEPIDKDVSAELKNNPESDKSKQLRQEFIDKRTDTYLKQGKNKVEANKTAIGDLAAIENSWKGTGFKVANSGASEFFGPLDKAHGLGLPESWRPKSLTDTVTQYLNSSAKRMAYHDAVQLKPEVQKALDIYSGNKHVQAIIGTITSNKMNEQTLFRALTGFTSRIVMGPISGAKEIMSAPFLGWQHLSNPTKAITYTTKALTEVPTSIASLWRTGRIQKHQNVLELGQYNNDFVGGLKDLMTEKGAIRALNRATNIASDFTGKNIGDKIGRALNFGQGKYAFLAAIKELDKSKLSGGAKLFLQTFAHDIDLSKPIGQAEIDKVGSRYVDSIQGTYDSRGLPRQVMDGSFTSSMLQLARWNVEKSNNYMKYSITPLINGNPKPFLMSTLGVALGGSMVALITEAISKRKQNVATLDELKASKEMGKDVTMDTFYKASALVSAAGHTGWLGDTLKAILDAAYGKTRPQFYNQILLQATTDAANVIKSFADNVRENGFTKELAFDAVAKILANNFQTYRVIETYMSQDRQLQIDKSNKLRDLRVFNTLEGNKLKDLSSPFQTKLVDPAMDKYKKASINDAVKMIPELIQRAKENSKGDPMKLIEELKKIKGDSFNTVPNPDTTEGALAFKRYKTFLSKTQGTNEANNRIKEYEMQKAINEAKTVYK